MPEQHWEVAEDNPSLARELMGAAGISRPTALVLAGLGIRPDQVERFLQPSLKDLVDPYRLPGTVATAERLWRAVRNGEFILIHGDYDTDGVTASVLLSWVLRLNGGRAECFLPHRIDDGYGLTPESIDKARTEQHSLLVTVDCGITSFAAVDAARRAGLDVLVTDHHEPGDHPPNANAVVDPKLPGADPELQVLAGVGVAFKVCHAFIKYGREHGLGGTDTDLREGLDLVALGTVADIVPLLHENRRLVKHGLRVLSRQQRPGIRALCEIAGIQGEVRTSDVTFRLAPRLNAAGRLGDPGDTMRLLRATSMQEAGPLAELLDRQNRERQQLEEEVLRQAEAQITARADLTVDQTVVVWGEAWHQGVVGIVASRLARRYFRPAIVLTRESNGHWCGSGRSIRRVNLVSALEQCRQWLVRAGGHPMAAGLSLEPQNLDAFRAGFEQAVRQQFSLAAMRPELEVVGAVGFAEITDPFLSELELLEPFGHGNPEPVFVARQVVPERVQQAGQAHTRGVLRDSTGARIDFIAFGRLPDDLPPPPWDLAYTPQVNRYGVRWTPQARLVDVRPASA